MATRIYGASDDLIEIDGDISEEFGAWTHDQRAQYLACSNGVLLRIRFTDDGDDGIWRITPVSGADHVQIWQCPADDPGRCSDIATIDGHLTWVALTVNYAKD